MAGADLAAGPSAVTPAVVSALIGGGLIRTSAVRIFAADHGSTDAIVFAGESDATGIASAAGAGTADTVYAVPRSALGAS